jgi:hypothetical protein
MADVTISGISTEATSLSDDDLLELEQGVVPSNLSAKGKVGLLRRHVLTSPVNAQTGTSYTLVLADAFKLVTMANASANTLTVPLNSSVAFPAGTRIDVGQDGTGKTTIAAAAGVTIRTPETLNLRKQWAKATLIKRATDTWDIEGNLEAAA